MKKLSVLVGDGGATNSITQTFTPEKRQREPTALAAPADFQSPAVSSGIISRAGKAIGRVLFTSLKTGLKAIGLRPFDTTDNRFVPRASGNPIARTSRRNQTQTEGFLRISIQVVFPL